MDFFSNFDVGNIFMTVETMTRYEYMIFAAKFAPNFKSCNYESFWLPIAAYEIKHVYGKQSNRSGITP